MALNQSHIPPLGPLASTALPSLLPLLSDLRLQNPQGRDGFCAGTSNTHLDARKHDCHQVVVWEQQGSDNAAIPDVFNDGCRRESKTLPTLSFCQDSSPPQPTSPPASRSPAPPTGHSPFTGFWCIESTKWRGFSIVYLRSRIVCEPVPSLHMPFLATLACSSSSASLLCSGLKDQASIKRWQPEGRRTPHEGPHIPPESLGNGDGRAGTVGTHAGSPGPLGAM